MELAAYHLARFLDEPYDVEARLRPREANPSRTRAHLRRAGQGATSARRGSRRRPGYGRKSLGPRDSLASSSGGRRLNPYPRAACFAATAFAGKRGDRSRRAAS